MLEVDLRVNTAYKGERKRLEKEMTHDDPLTPDRSSATLCL